MALTTEFLTGLGLTEEISNQVFAEHGRDLKKLQDTAANDKAKSDTVAAQLAEANKTIKELQKTGSDNEALQKQVTEYQEQAEAATKALEKTQLSSAVKLALTEAKARNLKAVEGLIDFGRITLKDGAVTGLDEQIKALTKAEDSSFMFGAPDAPNPKPNYNPKGGKTPPAENPFAKETFNLTKQGQMYRDNPEQAKEMAASANVKI